MSMMTHNPSITVIFLLLLYLTWLSRHLFAIPNKIYVGNDVSNMDIKMYEQVMYHVINLLL